MAGTQAFVHLFTCPRGKIAPESLAGQVDQSSLDEVRALFGELGGLNDFRKVLAAFRDAGEVGGFFQAIQCIA